MAISFYMALFLLAMVVCVVVDKRFEQVLAPLLCTIVTALYVLAMFRLLNLFVWLLYAMLLAGLILLFLRTRRTPEQNILVAIRRNVLTPGLLGFAIVAVLFYFASQNHYVDATDDIHYWAIEVRSILANRGLVDASHHLSPQFMTYTPGMQLYEWLGLAGTGEWNESVVYYMLWLFYAAFLLPLAANITWKKAYWLPVWIVVAVGLPTVMNNYSYSMLRVDTALGICLGFALIQAWQAIRNSQHRLFHLICYSLSLGMLVLIKQVGILWAIMAITFFLVLSPRRQYPNTNKAALLVFTLPLALFASWQLFCLLNGLNGVHTSNTLTNIRSILDGTWTAFPGIGTLVENFWAGLSQPTKTLEGFVMYFPLLDITRLGWMVVFLAIPIAFILARRDPEKRMKRLVIWIVGCYLLFVVGYLLVMATAFYEQGDAGVWNSIPFLVGRYCCPCLIGLLMLYLLMGAERLAVPMDKHSMTIARTTLSVLGGLLLFFSCNWDQAYHYLIPEQYQQLPHSDSLEELNTYAMDNFWLDDLTDPAGTVVLYGVGAEQYPYKPEWLQYVMAPAKLVLGPSELNDQQLVDLIRTNHITHVVTVDDANAVYEIASTYTADGWMDTYTLYHVSFDGDRLILE